MITSRIPDSIHICPQCEQDVARGIDIVTGKPRICILCVVENVRQNAALPYLKSDEPEEQPEKDAEPMTEPSLRVQAFTLILCAGFFVGVGFMSGLIVGRLWPN